MKRRNVFNSHSSTDDSRVQQVKGWLAQGPRVVANYSIDSTKPNRARSEGYVKYKLLSRRIRSSSVVAVLIGRDTHQSRWVKWEVEYAKCKNKCIVVIRLPGTHASDVPDYLCDFEKNGPWDRDSVVAAICNNEPSSNKVAGVPDVVRLACGS